MVSNPGTISVNFANTTLDLCAQKYEDFMLPLNIAGSFCNWTFDSILCWPPTPSGTIARQHCPSGVQGIDSTKYAERRCSTEGRWEGKANANGTIPQNGNPIGWTNYTPCYTPETLQLMKKLYAGGNDDVANIKLIIAERTRTLEIIGLSLSLFALLLSLVIFYRFRSLRNNRTRIHKNLFIAMVIQVVIRLTLYLDQAIIRNAGQDIGLNRTRSGIDNTPYLCEGSYVLLEYARTAMFMWMFIEGLYLHNVVTVMVFQGRFPHTMYALLGWGAPVIMTTIWAIFTAHHKMGQRCWWGYNLIPYYWILEGPRLAVILLNFLFLLNIIRVLVVKLRQSHTSDVEQVRKAVRAAVVLLPLLGITNLLNMTEAPLDRTAWEFAIWSYTTYFLTSFQGFFIAMLYCFLNGEVRTAIMKSISTYMSLRGHTNWIPRHQSMYSAAYVTAPDTDAVAGGIQCHTDDNNNSNNNNSNNDNSNNNNNEPLNRIDTKQHQSFCRKWITSICFPRIQHSKKPINKKPASPSSLPSLQSSIKSTTVAVIPDRTRV